jgi:hypothetical protein
MNDLEGGQNVGGQLGLLATERLPAGARAVTGGGTADGTGPVMLRGGARLGIGRFSEVEVGYFSNAIGGQLPRGSVARLAACSRN